MSVARAERGHFAAAEVEGDGPGQQQGVARREERVAGADMSASAAGQSVLQIFPPSVEFRNVEIGKTYTATLKVKVRHRRFRRTQWKLLSHSHGLQE